MFRTRGHHSIRLVRTLRHQIVDEYTDVGFVTAKGEGGEAAKLQGSVQACHKPLCGGFFIP